MGIPYNHVPMEQVLYCKMALAASFRQSLRCEKVGCRLRRCRMRPAFWRRKQRSTRNRLCGITFESSCAFQFFNQSNTPKGAPSHDMGAWGQTSDWRHHANLDFNPANRALRSRIKVAKGGAAFQSNPSDGKVSCHVSRYVKTSVGKFRPPPS